MAKPRAPRSPKDGATPPGDPPRVFGRRGLAPPPVLAEKAAPEAPGRRRIRTLVIGATAVGALAAWAFSGDDYATGRDCDPNDPMSSQDEACREAPKEATRRSGTSGFHLGFLGGWRSASPTVHASSAPASVPGSAGSIHFGGFGKTGASFHGSGT